MKRRKRWRLRASNGPLLSTHLQSDFSLSGHLDLEVKLNLKWPNKERRKQWGAKAGGISIHCIVYTIIKFHIINIIYFLVILVPWYTSYVLCRGFFFFIQISLIKYQYKSIQFIGLTDCREKAHSITGQRYISFGYICFCAHAAIASLATTREWSQITFFFLQPFSHSYSFKYRLSKHDYPQSNYSSARVKSVNRCFFLAR